MGVVEWERLRDLRQDQDRVLDVHVFGRLEAFGETLIGGKDQGCRQSYEVISEARQAYLDHVSVPFEEGSLEFGVLVEALRLGLLCQITLETAQLCPDGFRLICRRVIVPFVEVGEHVEQEEA